MNRAIERAATSVPPPGANATIISIGFAGYSALDADEMAPRVIAR
jgi:hypothetical protein